MKITGKLSGKEYEVLLAQHGFSYAVPVVQVPAKLFGFIPCNKQIRLEANPIDIAFAEHMYPGEMHAWFQKAVDHWESYEAAWQRARQESAK